MIYINHLYFSYHFYRASINKFFFLVQSGKGHLSTFAGVCCSCSFLLLALPSNHLPLVHRRYSQMLLVYDGGNIDKEQWLKFPPKPNEAKLNIMRRRLNLDPYIQHLDPIIHYIILVMCHNKSVLY